MVPTGILAGIPANSDAVELITSVFVLCYPDIKDIGELEKSERATWIRIREGLLQGHKAAIEALKTAVEILDKQADAEIQDMRARREESLKDQAAKRRRKNQIHIQRKREAEKQHELNLREKAQALRMHVAEHEQTLKERETKLANQSLKERLLIAMTAVSFTCAVGFVIAGFITGQAFAYGSGGAFSVIWCIGMIRLFLLGQGKNPTPPHEGPPGN